MSAFGTKRTFASPKIQVHFAETNSPPADRMMLLELSRDDPSVGNRILVRIHKSMTASRIGCEQQTRRLPSAGCSSGCGS
jgi:hypothetical protein